MTVMKNFQIRNMLLRAHYHLMDNPRFWYENGLMDASRILCEKASELNKFSPFTQVSSTEKRIQNAKSE